MGTESEAARKAGGNEMPRKCVLNQTATQRKQKPFTLEIHWFFGLSSSLPCVSCPQFAAVGMVG